MTDDLEPGDVVTVCEAGARDGDRGMFVSATTPDGRIACQWLAVREVKTAVFARGDLRLVRKAHPAEQSQVP